MNSSSHFNKKPTQGFSLIELVIVSGMMSIIMFAGLAFFQNQTKANNFLEFQSKREQLRSVLLGQFLNDPDNCRCLFFGATSFPAAGTALLAGVTPTEIGRYDFTNVGALCGGTATMPAPFITAAGVDSLRLISAELRSIQNPTAGVYQAEFSVVIQAARDVLGPNQLAINVPVLVNTTPAGPNVNFQSCSMSGAAVGAMPLQLAPTPPAMACTGGLDTTFTTCPANTLVNSCGIVKTTDTAGGNEDSHSCSIVPASNRCRFFRDRGGTTCEGLVLECYCRPI